MRSKEVNEFLQTKIWLQKVGNSYLSLFIVSSMLIFTYTEYIRKLPHLIFVSIQKEAQSILENQKLDNEGKYWLEKKTNQSAIVMHQTS